MPRASPRGSSTRRSSSRCSGTGSGSRTPRTGRRVARRTSERATSPAARSGSSGSRVDLRPRALGFVGKEAYRGPFGGRPQHGLQAAQSRRDAPLRPAVDLSGERRRAVGRAARLVPGAPLARRVRLRTGIRALVLDPERAARARPLRLPRSVGLGGARGRGGEGRGRRRDARAGAPRGARARARRAARAVRLGADARLPDGRVGRPDGAVLPRPDARRSRSARGSRPRSSAPRASARFAGGRSTSWRPAADASFAPSRLPTLLLRAPPRRARRRAARRRRLNGGRRCLPAVRGRVTLRAMVEPPTGAVTFLFTDIEGSTRLVKQLRDALRRRAGRPSELAARARSTRTAGTRSTRRGTPSSSRSRVRATRSSRRSTVSAHSCRTTGPRESRSRCAWAFTRDRPWPPTGATRASPCIARRASGRPGTAGRSSSRRPRRRCSRTRRRTSGSSCGISASST